MHEFKKIVADIETLDSIVGKVSLVAAEKPQTELDVHCRSFIDRSPFVLIGSCDSNGNFDISPKGDPAGFVSVLDEHTLVIPDRPGNRRADTSRNVLANPSVGLIFLIPGKKETLRVSGQARIIQDEEVLQTMAVRGKIPKLGLAVHVVEAFFHCAKCIIRSNLWNPESWPSLEGLPTLAETLASKGKTKIPKTVLQAGIAADEKLNLY